MRGSDQRTLKKDAKESLHTNSSAHTAHALPVAGTPLASSIEALTCCLQDATSHDVRIAVGCWPPVLHVALTGLLRCAGNANGGTAVSNSELEVLDAASLVLAGQSLVVALSIGSDVLLGNLAESLADLLDDIDATCLSHGLDGEVG